MITVYYREGIEVGAQARLKFKVHVTGFWLAWGQCVAEIISFCGLAWLLSGVLSVMGVDLSLCVTLIPPTP